MQLRLLHQSAFRLPPSALAIRLLPVTLIATVLLATQLPTVCTAKPMWQKLVPRKKVAADPQGDYTLTETNGPWLVMAMYFAGEEGEAKARELVLDLRQNHGLPAFHWGMSFQLDDANPGRGIDDYGGKIRRRYRRGNQVTQHAVLVGNFPSLGDPEAQDILKQIKTITPNTLRPDGESPTAESLTNIDKFRNYLRKNHGKEGLAGPMSHAFVTRNPLLPKEYFAPVGVDEDVAKWNSGQEFSLLKCPKKYSIKVATFKGRTSLVKAGRQGDSDTRTRKAKKDDPLVVAVKNAHLLTMALREKGWEAYEFHDRHQSYVTVGSFDEGQQVANDSIRLNDRDAQIIIDTFGALTPNNIFNRPAQQDLQLEQQKKRQFAKRLGNQGQVASGFHPKKFVGLPFDIYPKPVVVPRRSVSSAYARN
ncbi:MAG: hypothetical protein GXP24_11925 [Planctomycetes bacterium]|nr:hypothetical protein [Planctomycetota bacterium]